jgi:murein DD-endopeptidase MepM/ murein hydrolase activator NlpD
MKRCSILKSSNRILSFFLLFSIGIVAGQTSIQPASSVDSGSESSGYIFPINPGIQNTLAGTMGELRRTHFHSGLDIRTNNTIGLPVRAAQSGYISKAAKSPYSYGNVLYITHPNGHTTLYAHLDRFSGKIAEHIRAEQYRTQQSQIELQFAPGQFPVAQGDTIALSGNTGSSSGPHLHFDIRDVNMDAINPLHYGFDEIKDRIAPVVSTIALRTMDAGSRINGKFGRFEFHVVKSGGKFKVLNPIHATGNIGIEILAYDRMDNTQFQCGINEYSVLVNAKNIFNQHINRIDMELTRGILSLMDNAVMETRGKRFNRLYVDDGNPLSIYSGVINQGIIRIGSQTVSIQINMKDSYGNKAEANLQIDPEQKTDLIPALDAIKTPASFERLGHYLIARLPNCGGQAELYADVNKSAIKPDYHSKKWSVYIIDLRKAAPDSIIQCGSKLKFNFSETIPAHTNFTYYAPTFKIHFPDSALFDTLFFKPEHQLEGKREVFKAGDKTIPLLSPIQIELNALLNYSDKYAVFRQDDNRRVQIPAQFENGKIRFETNRLGRFVIQPDSLAPTIIKLGLSHHGGRFRIYDNLSGINHYEARINGNWVLLNYDYKTGILATEKKDKNMLLQGDFLLQVTDNCGNVKTFKQKLI